ncbi:uncharacterized protein SPPG_01624 [Spizellomyces punctatus DAOM BR117]|uniref:Uncharacterized protein n=1 Tax=Spizellomyces punctatus (strain DAOM BR117) TaxID=645134 RepID=A0A0L0HTG8_SPIPD|nr:uncharacterized protein SPPG_01624 [Spizellomyces punctatus DAOM BR117]KND04190.1 hypothetical protein SPPG_01624 [Spizellomyces punctatus DAOM BR117]|eukprot:XP_016612229.1 hypothetical protein SPPG_01624 [Spizellomyces punctatus DAOM BR117]
MNQCMHTTDTERPIWEGKQVLREENSVASDGPLPPFSDPQSAPVGGTPVDAEPKEKLMYIMRGAPGSGKSTVARDLLVKHGNKGCILSTDDFFCIDTGNYEFNAAKLAEAHEWNQERARDAISSRMSPIIIDNTHTQKWEAKPYVEMGLKQGYSIVVVEPETPWWKEKNVTELAQRNTHGVSAEAIQRMVERWEDDFTVDAILASERPGSRRDSPRDMAMAQAREEGRQQASLEIAERLRVLAILTEEQIIEVTTLSVHIERYYAQPQFTSRGRPSRGSPYSTASWSRTEQGTRGRYSDRFYSRGGRGDTFWTHHRRDDSGTSSFTSYSDDRNVFPQYDGSRGRHHSRGFRGEWRNR